MDRWPRIISVAAVGDTHLRARFDNGVTKMYDCRPVIARPEFRLLAVPAFFVLTKVGLTNNLWGLIIPGAATPTGVFLLRQYMLTIPDDLIQSARIDGASEWRIYAQIMLPLTGPALAVLAIFSVMWRWNDFLWPLVAISQSELFTLQVGLRAFSGELNQQWNYILAMTVLTMLPITIVFALLEKYITTGIATTGMK